MYGPQSDTDKVTFLAKVSALRQAINGPWLLCGDWNLIYCSQDKNNGRLDRRSMRRFRQFIDQLLIDELPLTGRLYTWSNEQDNPTMERLDRFFADLAWLELFPGHCLKPLSSDYSDHCPLLLQVLSQPWTCRRFRFEFFWVKLPGFLDVVTAVWAGELRHADPCRTVDNKLRNLARALKCWSSKQVGSVRLQLSLAREVVFRLDSAMESRTLTAQERALRKDLKVRTLGLASLSRTIARQRSRLRFLAEGEANTRFFQLQACHRGRKNVIRSLSVNGNEIVANEQMACALWEFYNSVLGSDFERPHRLNLQALGVPTFDLAILEEPFTEEEVWAVIRDLPNERAPGPDGYTGLFYKTAWPIIKFDILAAFNAFWSLDYRSFHLLNDAFMILLKKKPAPLEIRDYRPISLMHSFGKLVAKCLAYRLVLHLNDIILPNQSAFIRGRGIHDNFHSVQLMARALHARKSPTLLLKIDIARAFDSVAWPFLLEVLQHMGFGPRWR